MKFLNGNTLAEEKLDAIALRARAVEKSCGRRPSLAVVLVGDDAPSHLYVKLKREAAQSVGIDFHIYSFAQDEAEGAIVQALTFLETDSEVDAILIQMPLPDGFNADHLVQVMGAQKDVDGFHRDNEAAFLRGDAQTVCPVFPHALLALAQSAQVSLDGKRAALVVNSHKFGRVLAKACQNEGLMPQIILAEQLPCMQSGVFSSDVVITACGVPRMLTSAYIKKGAVVIDGGISTLNGKTVGDVDVASLEKDKKEVWLSPVPGGVGPMTIACLLENVVTLAERQHRT